MYHAEHMEVINSAVAQLEVLLDAHAPQLAAQVRPWMHALAGSRAPADYFTHPVAFPMLLLPWWAEERYANGHDLTFQRDLARSTLSGYYYIRLVDNLMDGDETVERQILPAAGLFHWQFQSSYHTYFPAEHPFWIDFATAWGLSAEMTAQDAQITTFDRGLFQAVAARKVCAARIPQAAVCHRYGASAEIAPWNTFIDLLGCWHQFWNDLLGWHKDAVSQRPTYLLSEHQRVAPEMGLGSWMVREGFEWGLTQLESWMAELQRQAAVLGCRPLEVYLVRRAEMLRQSYAQAQAGLQALAQILDRVQR